ncbi:MAG: 30S ribosomal protein S1, partial [Candidatus Omnitrophica bacterium CG12_big_fil_rev_8_21_14_0_65_50_5]
MNNDSKQSVMEQLYQQTFRDLKDGEIVKGKIVAVNDQEVVVDIGFKSEGFVSREELRNRETINIGDEVEVLIESMEDENGYLVLSY